MFGILRNRNSTVKVPSFVYNGPESVDADNIGLSRPSFGALWPA